MNAQERRAAIRSSLAIAPRPKMSSKKIQQLLELLHDAEMEGDDVLLMQIVQHANGALMRLHAERARAAAQSQP